MQYFYPFHGILIALIIINYYIQAGPVFIFTIEWTPVRGSLNKRWIKEVAKKGIKRYNKGHKNDYVKYCKVLQLEKYKRRVEAFQKMRLTVLAKRKKCSRNINCIVKLRIRYHIERNKKKILDKVILLQ
uniref:Cystatin domain-containing protein n=1 Tax=Strongyloides papillosus TaxID=174720 RepID=A0A0N5BXF1_STREA